MPYISIESGRLTAEQKKELIERLTATASEITHIPAQFFTVTIKELSDENFGMAANQSMKSSRTIKVRIMNIQKELEHFSTGKTDLRFNNVEVIPEAIRAIMINEVVPSHSEDDFYGKQDAAYMSTTIQLFRKAGIEVDSVQDILDKGIYITNAVKTPKTGYAVSKESIEESLPYLERELALFPNVKVIMLMGDVAKKAFNMISKKTIKKNAVPSVSTYKLRKTEILYNSIRILPSYIMTGQNILIEKSKFEMASEDISIMYGLITKQ